MILDVNEKAGQNKYKISLLLLLFLRDKMKAINGGEGASTGQERQQPSEATHLTLQTMRRSLPSYCYPTNQRPGFWKLANQDRANRESRLRGVIWSPTGLLSSDNETTGHGVT